MFLYLFNKIKFFEKSFPTHMIKLYFHSHVFDYFLNQVIYFEALDKTVNDLAKQFESYNAIKPIFWFHFTKHNIKYTEEEKNRKTNVSIHKEEYRIELKGDFWEVN